MEAIGQPETRMGAVQGLGFRGLRFILDPK